MYVIYKENDAGIRYYYGTYSHKNANEIALDLNDRDDGYYYCVCPADEATLYGISNLPVSYR